MCFPQTCVTFDGLPPFEASREHQHTSKLSSGKDEWILAVACMIRRPTAGANHQPSSPVTRMPWRRRHHPAPSKTDPWTPHTMLIQSHINGPLNTSHASKKLRCFFLGSSRVKIFASARWTQCRALFSFTVFPLVSSLCDCVFGILSWGRDIKDDLSWPYDPCAADWSVQIWWLSVTPCPGLSWSAVAHEQPSFLTPHRKLLCFGFAASICHAISCWEFFLWANRGGWW